MMPQSSNRRPYEKDENRYRNDQVPGSFLIRHGSRTFKALSYLMDSVDQNAHFWTFPVCPPWWRVVWGLGYGAPGGNRTREYWFCKVAILSAFSYLQKLMARKSME